MLCINKLREKILKSEPVFGVFCSIPNPTAVEIIGEAGFDFIIIDTEHVMVNPETLENMIRATERFQMTALVRVLDDSHEQIVRILDAGAQGIVLPMVENEHKVIKAIEACYYYPKGKRSLNAGRPGAFGRSNAFGDKGLVDYMAFANEQIMLVPMIESQKGIDAIHKITSISEVSFILEGAADLSQSMGVPWQFQHVKVQNGLSEIITVCKESNVSYCAIPRGNNEVEYLRYKGVNIFVLGDERGIAFRALVNCLEKAKSDSTNFLP